MRNIKVTIEYDGTGYHGWQSQENAISVQRVVEDAFKKLTGENIKIIGASRTDTGVHAYGQVANFFTESKIPGEKFFLAVNSLLPPDISIVHSEEVQEDFHSRFCAKGKKYKYLIYNDRAPSALLRSRAFHVPVPLKLEDMKKAAGFIPGKKDFSAFKASGSSVKDSVRTVTGIELQKKDNIIELTVSGDGFLYNMVRIIAGTLIDVGMGRIAPDELSSILESMDRTRAGRTAPAHGLYLVEVYY
ncbi:tRNA pseudouridine(38-40) synthase TruA [Pseudobacteroides cellulosolvens]|uniref:tRNA pseudouridine synthase A n=1 Tax=Pseudobacteroides cellulosolvens ATCC 35603 = DSM 2933 TaxID=398512 RepID=A0A0L6JPE6_9FIRM|nr:tRNA pseudouridine(38-40) synthase TruA [Pseudobacteroides cellulosolvens]KNY27232.1 tRNA pseudouridine synthase A [Pseudobacteroides cellulosolvens ATCC 35603 = DSM 2933]